MHKLYTLWQGIALGLAVFLLGGLLNACDGQAKLLSSNPESTIQTLPIEEIVPKSATIARQKSLTVDVVVGLPNSCYHFESLQTIVDEEQRTLTFVANGRMEGDFCAEVYETQRQTYTTPPLTTAGNWSVLGKRFNETITAQVTVK